MFNSFISLLIPVLAATIGPVALLQLLHEAGHAVAARQCGVPVRGVTLGVFSGTYAFGPTPDRRWGNYLAKVDLDLDAIRGRWSTTLIAGAGTVPLLPFLLMLCCWGPSWSIATVLDAYVRPDAWVGAEHTKGSICPYVLWVARTCLMANCVNLVPVSFRDIKTDGRFIWECWVNTQRLPDEEH